MVAQLLRGEDGDVIGTTGFYVDVTFPPEERETFITDAVAEKPRTAPSSNKSRAS